jgi:hypothetical protein
MFLVILVLNNYTMLREKNSLHLRRVSAPNRMMNNQDSDPKQTRPYWHLLVVSLEIDAGLGKPVGSQ